MQTRTLGYTGEQLTTVGLGAWAIGGPWLYGWGPQDDGDSVDTILEAMEAGINWIDTAPIYGHGRSEKIVGATLKQLSKKPFIATKCALTWDAVNERIPCLKAQSIREECFQSLKRLDIDVIDLYQIHFSQPDEDIEEGWEEVARLKEQGLVRHIGVSNFNVEQLKRIHKIHPPASLQPPYSMINRGIEEDLLEYCGQNNIGVICYSPMQRGLLTGKFTAERVTSLPPGDHRKTNDQFQEPQFSATLELVEGLKEIAERTGHTSAQLSVSWTLRRGELTAAIVGARRKGQIAETAKASDYQLTEAELEEIEQLLKLRQEKING